MQKTLDWRVVHLIAWILRSSHVVGLVRTGLDDPLDGLAFLCQLEVVPSDLDGHSALDVTLGALEHLKLDDLVLGVKGHHVLRRLLVEEGRQTIDDFALMTRVLDRVEKGLLAIGRNIDRFLGNLLLSHLFVSHSMLRLQVLKGEGSNALTMTNSTLTKFDSRGHLFNIGPSMANKSVFAPEPSPI